MTHILIVDDEYAIVEMLKIALEDEGYTVITASNGREALMRLTTLLPSVIICDVMMPVMGGKEMCRQIQADPRYRSIPIILMSAVSKSVSKAECHFSFLLSKPFDLDTILLMIQGLLPG